VVGLFIVILSVTGAIAAFGPELDALFNRKLFHVEPQNTPPLPFQMLAGIISQKFGEPVNTLRMPSGPDQSYMAAVARGQTQVFVNGYTGEILGTRSPKTFWAKTVQFHKRLAPATGKGWPEIGNKIVAIACWAMLFLLLSGLYLWWPHPRFSVKWKASLRRVMFDLHNATGIYAFVFSDPHDNRLSGVLRRRDHGIPVQGDGHKTYCAVDAVDARCRRHSDYARGGGADCQKGTRGRFSHHGDSADRTSGFLQHHHALSRRPHRTRHWTRPKLDFRGPIQRKGTCGAEFPHGSGTHSTRMINRAIHRDIFGVRQLIAVSSFLAGAGYKWR
jgi:hypothetical protein